MDAVGTPCARTTARALDRIARLSANLARVGFGAHWTPVARGMQLVQHALKLCASLPLACDRTGVGDELVTLLGALRDWLTQNGTPAAMAAAPRDERSRIELALVHRLVTATVAQLSTEAGHFAHAFVHEQFASEVVADDARYGERVARVVRTRLRRHDSARAAFMRACDAVAAAPADIRISRALVSAHELHGALNDLATDTVLDPHLSCEE
jgi:hypothetical protein